MLPMQICAECGDPFEPRRNHGRFCRDTCRVRWNRRNARGPAEPSAGSRAAALDLAQLVGARQAGKITAGQFAAAAVSLINTTFTSVNEALIALGTLAWEGLDRATVAPDREHEDA